MSWGYRVIIILTVFVIGILAMVVLAVRQNVDMMDEHYYEKEIEFQGIIDARKNLEKYHDSIVITQNGANVKVQIPAVAAANISEGYLEFLRQNDKSKDRKVSIAADSTGVQWLARSEFVKGIYRLRARWVSEGVDYYDERNIRIE